MCLSSGALCIKCPCMTEGRDTSLVLQWATTRPAILHATNALGMNDSQVARHIGVHPNVVSEWGRGIRPIPRIRHVTLLLMVRNLLEALHWVQVAGNEDVFCRLVERDGIAIASKRDAVRRDAVLDAAARWFNVSILEEGEVTEEEAAAALALLDLDAAQWFERVRATDEGREPRDLAALLERHLADEQ